MGQPVVWLVRHGETEWSRDGLHTGRTEVELTEAGEEQARALAPFVSSIGFDLVLCSPRRRARRTAELANLVPYEATDTLREWDYGELEGRTTAEIQGQFPDWSIWQGPWLGGETAADVSGRADRVIARVRESGASKVALVGHGHFSRVIGSRWVGAGVSTGQWLSLDTASWSRLGSDRGIAVLDHWNVPVRPLPAGR